jgi:Rap1a immunity proteins
MTNAKFLVVTVSFYFAILHIAPAAAQEDTQSGNFFIAPCRVVASGATPKDDDLFLAGVCVGRIEALAWGATGFRDEPIRSCRPGAVTDVQLAKVVVAYMDRNPARLHEPFNGLVLEALAKAWPCPRG